MIYLVVRQTVYNRLDEDLRAESLELYHSLVILSDELIISNPDEWQEPEHGNVEVNPVFIQVIDSTGKNIKRSNNLKGENLPFKSTISDKIYFNTHYPVKVSVNTRFRW